mgnify:FL=1
MSVKISATEEHIKETAKKVFLKEGRYNATTQEIADAAGVNRTLLHYYFRSREVLLEKVLLEGQKEFRQKLTENYDKELPFKERISLFIDVWMGHIKEYPFLDAYLVTQMHDGNFIENLETESKSTATNKASFFKEMEAEMKAGHISKMEPIQFLLNLISMISYPLIMRPLMEKALILNKKAYNKIIAERKEAIMACLFK